MNIINIMGGFPLDRESLEQMALEEVCACQLYDLSDYLEVTSDQELINIILHEYDCELCGRRSLALGGSNA